MDKQTQLSKAIKIASWTHVNQFDQGGKPYILHPLHLMQQLLFDIELATVAVLHDVIEDSNITLGQLKIEGFSQRILEALDCLTHKQNETYEEYIERICLNYDAIRVKRKDLEHNSNITRLKGVSSKDLKRIEKYQRAFLRLTEAKKQFKSITTGTSSSG